MRPNFNRALSLSLGVMTVFCVSMAGMTSAYAQQDPVEVYNNYTEQGSRAFKAGQLSQAITAFEQAMRYAPEESTTIVYNNLAASYMSRANYLAGQKKYQESLNDYRRAYFYLQYGWPEGAERKDVHNRNLQVAKQNLGIGYSNINVNPSDRSAHLSMAKQLRLQGKFVEAIVEYSQALDLQKNDLETSKAVGDLYTVINLPEKSKKYYGQAANSIASTPNSNVSDDVLVQLGTSQAQTGEVDKAVQSFDKALAINPKNPAALNQLEKIWRDEIKFNPKSVLGHANLGSVLQKKGDFEGAIQQYSVAEMFSEQVPGTSFDVKKQLRLNMGTLFQQKKDYQKAQAAYSTVLQADPSNQQANFYMATLFEETGNLDGAITGYNKVLAADPNNKGAQDKLLSLVKKQTDPAKLTAGMKEYAARFPNNATIQAQIGEEFHKRKDLPNAALLYQKALAIDPRLSSTWANLGALYEEQGKQTESLQAYKKAQDLDPSNKTYQDLAQGAESQMGYEAYKTALDLQQKGKHTDALPYFQKALQTNNTAETHLAYAVSLHNANQLDAAIGEYSKAIAMAPNNADYQYYLGTAYHQKNDLPRAEAAYKKAVSLNPNQAEAKQMLASIQQGQVQADLQKAMDYYDHKNYVAALTAVNAALAKNGQDPTAHYYKGLILEGQNKRPTAIQSYREAIRYDANFADAYYALGVALDTNSDPVGARSAYEKFVTLSANKDDDTVKYAQQRVQALSQR